MQERQQRQDRIPPIGSKHPEHWRPDLNPASMAGQNLGTTGANQWADALTAFDIKAAHRRLEGFDDAELKRIPILPAGTRLQQGGTYIDLKDPACAELTARGDQAAGPDNWYVPKDAVDYQLWNRLIGVQNPGRLGLADEGAADHA